MGRTVTGPVVLPMTDVEIAEYGALCVANRQRDITSREALREYLELHPKILARASYETLQVALLAALVLYGGEVGDDEIPRKWRKWVKVKAKSMPKTSPPGTLQDAVDAAIKGLL